MAFNPLLPAPSRLQTPSLVDGEPRLTMSLMPDGHKASPVLDADEQITLPGLPYAVADETDAILLQAGNLRLYEAWTKRKRSKTRSGLLNANSFVERNARMVRLEGEVVDFRCEGSRITRICLLSPRVWTKGDDGILENRPEIIDTHIWLFANRLQTPGDRVVRIHLGQSLTVKGRIGMYDSRHQRRQLGITDWTPLECALYYRRFYRNGTSCIRGASAKHVTGMPVLDVDHGRVHWHDARILLEQRERALEGVDADSMIIHDSNGSNIPRRGRIRAEEGNA